MTQPNLKVDTGALVNLAAEIEATQSQMRAAQAAIQSAGDEARSVWHGAAANACQAALDEWSTDFGQMYSGLTTLHDELAAATGGLSEAEEAAASQASS